MSKTALSVIQAFLKGINEPFPTAIYGETDPGTLQVYQLLIDACEEIRQKAYFTQQKKTYSFTTSNGVASYQLPKDFYRPLPKTQYNQDESGLLYGPTTDADWTARTQGAAASSINFAYRLFGGDDNPNSAGGQFYLNPTPSSSVDLYFEYVSRDLFKPKNWEPSTAYTTSDYVNANGINFKYSGNGTSGTTAPTAAGSDGTATIALYTNAYETLLADTDLLVFHDELVKKGFKYKYIEALGGDYSLAQSDFYAAIAADSQRLEGFRYGTLADEPMGPRYVVPYRNWGL